MTESTDGQIILNDITKSVLLIKPTYYCIFTIIAIKSHEYNEL